MIKLSTLLIKVVFRRKLRSSAILVKQEVVQEAKVKEMLADYLNLEGLRIKDAPKFETAIDWIINSGIQSKDGAFHAWYDLEKESYSFLYPETTGYAINLLVRLWRTGRKRLFLNKAIEAGDWLVKVQRKNGAFYCKYYNDASDRVSENCDRSLYAFDAGICLSGLLDLYEATSDVRYLEAAVKAGNWLSSLQNSDGSLVAGYNANGDVIEDCHWSRTSSCHHLKNTLSLLKLYQMTRRKKYLGSAAKLLKWGQKLQVNSGRFTVYPNCDETYFHANCYAIEGLLFSSKLLNNITNITPTERAILASQWLSKVQNTDGSLWNWYNSDKEKIKVSDALSQAIGIWLITRRLLPKHQQNRKFSSNIEKGLTFLSSQQRLNGDKHTYGGFYYGEQNEKKIEHVNTWVAFFALRIPLLLKETNNASRMIDLLF
jgi:hypothetical protein